MLYSRFTSRKVSDKIKLVTNLCVRRCLGKTSTYTSPNVEVFCMNTTFIIKFDSGSDFQYKNAIGSLRTFLRSWKSFYTNTHKDNIIDIEFVINSKPEKRKLHTRIIPSSGLPETLHHSVQTIKYYIEKKLMTPDKAIEKYLQNKTNKKDSVMLDLYDKNKHLVRKYVEQFAS